MSAQQQVLQTAFLDQYSGAEDKARPPLYWLWGMDPGMQLCLAGTAGLVCCWLAMGPGPADRQPAAGCIVCCSCSPCLASDTLQDLLS